MKSNAMGEALTFYFIRHAEKDRSDPSNRDPSLTEEGHARALKWAEVLKAANIKAVYSTNYKRTIQTALPAAKQGGLKVERYDPYTLNFDFLKKE